METELEFWKRLSRSKRPYKRIIIRGIEKMKEQTWNSQDQAIFEILVKCLVAMTLRKVITAEQRQQIIDTIQNAINKFVEG